MEESNNEMAEENLKTSTEVCNWWSKHNSQGRQEYTQFNKYLLNATLCQYWARRKQKIEQKLASNPEDLRVH